MSMLGSVRLKVGLKTLFTGQLPTAGKRETGNRDQNMVLLPGLVCALTRLSGCVQLTLLDSNYAIQVGKH